MNRAHSLDTLRGFAIIAMIFSGTIGSGKLPAWMYHAQVGPRSEFSFDPNIYGITWVDIVFPFFLFAMGAAFPFSIGKKIEKEVSYLSLVWDSLLRGFKLAYFAIFIQHMYPWVLSYPENYYSWGVSLLSFALMFFMFSEINFKKNRILGKLLKFLAYIIGIIMLQTVDYADERTFSLYNSNIIIMVLANMAIFASIIYIFTYNRPMRRLLVLPFIMAVLLGSSTENSWVKSIYDFTPVSWFYSFSYLKYLFIVIPGSIVGEYLKNWNIERKLQSESYRNPVEHYYIYIMLLSLMIIVSNIYGLYMRYLLLNLIVTVFLLILLYFLLLKKDANFVYWRKLYVFGAYLLVLGLFFEAYEGGIRKDYSTYSYYFVTSGLACFAMIVFSIVSDIYNIKWVKFLESVGQNPMIAYVAPQLVVIPLIGILGMKNIVELLNTTALLGLLKGVLLTTFSVSVAIICTKKKIFWRT